jgi:hypothetical protein
VRFIGPLIDLLRFVRGRDGYIAVLPALDHLTHQSFDSSSDPLSDLMIWDGTHTELSMPPGYTAWKGELYAEMIDPRFRNFLDEGAPTRIRGE